MLMGLYERRSITSAILKSLANCHVSSVLFCRRIWWPSEIVRHVCDKMQPWWCGLNLWTWRNVYLPQ